MENITRVVSKSHLNQGGARSPSLVWIYPTGPGMGTRYFIQQPVMILGRDENCDIIVETESVSRQHARIEIDNKGNFLVSDLGSTNGSFVNEKAANKTPINNGDYLRLGACQFRFLGEGNVEADYHEVIYNLTILDPLTGCGNKRLFMENLDKEVSRSNRYQRPLSLIMADLDHFKKINDSMGHSTGDATLKVFAQRVKECIRAEEIFCRYGGEEFAIILPETTLISATTVAERIRVRFSGEPIQFGQFQFIQTASFGVTTSDGNPPVSAEQLIQLADKNLYQAKNTGRNKVV